MAGCTGARRNPAGALQNVTTQIRILHQLDQMRIAAAYASRALLKSHGISPQALRREGRWRRALAALRGEEPLAEIRSAADTRTKGIR